MHRDDDPSAPVTAIVGIVSALLLFLVIVLLQAYFYRAQRAERARKVEQTPVEDVAALHATQRELLASYRWVDQQRGVVGIPVERAMELIAREGIAAPPPPPAP